MRLKISLIILFSILYAGSLTAQRNNNKITITGTVLDLSRFPIVNAIVMIDGRNTSSVTDTKGQYKVRVKRAASKIGILTFGNGIVEQSIDGRTLIDFNFSVISNQGYYPDLLEKEEGVDIGYNYIKKKNLTNAVGIFDPKNSKRTYRSVYEMIQEIPGIDAKVFNMFGPVGPTYVVDGMMVSSLNNILPSQVESIVFLRDASAAIYGSRAFGGVVVIRTRIAN